MMTNKQLLKELKDYRKVTDNELEKDVIDIVLDEGEKCPIDYILNVINYGCVSGCVSALTYYKDTKEFFIKHFEDIFKVYNNLIREGYEFTDKELDSNSLAWIGFESVVNDLHYKFINTEE